MFGIELKNVGKRFGANEVLRDIDLSIPKGSFTAIVGKSGCGKSTLLRVIAGLEEVTSGSLAYTGAEAKKSNIRIMFQDDRLLPWKNILKNIAIGGVNKVDAEIALEKVGLRDKKGDWPDELSGGQKQRVALARALASSPDVLLFDEPLGALDALTRMDMQHLMEGLWQEQHFTSILVTHDVSEAVYLADRVIVLDEGGVKLDQDIDLGRPRERDDKFTSYEKKILDQIVGG
ncbi:aliphatic sulfonates import ATP-binding protein SsuB [Oceanobacillus oncorhynchi subsp. incaldanensis]|uniref:ABC transporter ATP-binding protein n=1 Tax=Oceanobacillus TaxID=182709 RepID=UPI0018665715|nr:ATP-binding cassette domain-containing protein [Oceanobacillus oncorhynchi]MDM8102194.1 ATP-binding cassette domain-containing protein [Oceanobacillus oncorhynchi]UUI40246.1 ATP-binding cassette domain-containing protein [Oceanobacillus oncorhynchi]GIO19505.1 aliphatic sulfonates import ATP-binding protein SsuB [Oceanobacillus oncorhynchi subsp. incaldanensis]